jgi:hypothetical protein
MPRKATTQRSVTLDRPRIPVALISIVFVGILVTVGAIMWGRSDTGVIDVSATISNSQYVTENAGNADVAQVPAPTQQYVDMPNGGLVAAEGGSDTPPAPVLPDPSLTASSTATTTTEGDTESGENTEATTTTDGAGEATLDTEATTEEAAPTDAGEPSADPVSI